MQPNQEYDEISQMLEDGYAAPPLEDAFSSNLIRQLQAEVAQQSRLPHGHQARWAVAWSGLAVAASIVAVVYVLNPLGTKPSGQQVAVRSLPSSEDGLNTSLESKNTRGLQTQSRESETLEIGEAIASDGPAGKSRDGEAARGTVSREQELEREQLPRVLAEQEHILELSTTVPRDFVQQDGVPTESLSTMSKFERLSEAKTELDRTNGLKGNNEGVRQGGTWPKDWPQGLEPLRAQSKSEFHMAKRVTVEHRIPFADRALFEAAWPHFLDLMKRKHFKFVLASSSPAELDPFIGVAVVRPDPEEDLSQEAEIPEFKKTGVFLFVDGEIIDLNRIQLPADTPIIDERFKEPKSK